MIAEDLQRDPYTTVPPNFILYLHPYNHRFGACQEGAIDRRIKEAAVMAGIPLGEVSNHVLRRTGARMMYLAGVDMEDISAMLGHADTKTTMLYIGLTVEDLRRARERTSDYLDQVRARMMSMPQPLIEIQRPVLLRR